eukprot:TRINITY_DN20055_c0_g1_i1.p1 TRINITY_DN20055_c0_g1~~TRINITY_DN20055_c0_g1_i1.p1  ORF type:complete len:1404 (+),score=182.55 TRINITY_DN20055_c0_g1_i1:624-4214(+)
MVTIPVSSGKRVAACSLFADLLHSDPAIDPPFWLLGSASADLSTLETAVRRVVRLTLPNSGHLMLELEALDFGLPPANAVAFGANEGNVVVRLLNARLSASQWKNVFATVAHGNNTQSSSVHAITDGTWNDEVSVRTSPDGGPLRLILWGQNDGSPVAIGEATIAMPHEAAEIREVVIHVPEIGEMVIEVIPSRHPSLRGSAALKTIPTVPCKLEVHVVEVTAPESTPAQAPVFLRLAVADQVRYSTRHFPENPVWYERMAIPVPARTSSTGDFLSEHPLRVVLLDAQTLSPLGDVCIPLNTLRGHEDVPIRLPLSHGGEVYLNLSSSEFGLSPKSSPAHIFSALAAASPTLPLLVPEDRASPLSLGSRPSVGSSATLEPPGFHLRVTTAAVALTGVATAQVEMEVAPYAARSTHRYHTRTAPRTEEVQFPVCVLQGDFDDTSGTETLTVDQPIHLSLLSAAGDCIGNCDIECSNMQLYAAESFKVSIPGVADVDLEIELVEGPPPDWEPNREYRPIFRDVRATGHLDTPTARASNGSMQSVESEDETLRAIIRRLEEDLLERDSTVAFLQAKLDHKDQEITHFQSASLKSESQSARARNSVSELRNQYDKRLQEVELLLGAERNTAEESKRRMLEAQMELQSARDELGACEAELQQLRLASRATEQHSAQARSDMDAMRRAYDARLQELEKKIESDIQMLEESRRQLQQTQLESATRVHSSDARASQAEAALEQLSTENDQLRDQLATTAETEAALQRKRLKSRQRKAEITTLQRQLTDALQALEKQRYNLAQEQEISSSLRTQLVEAAAQCELAAVTAEHERQLRREHERNAQLLTQQLEAAHTKLRIADERLLPTNVGVEPNFDPRNHSRLQGGIVCQRCGCIRVGCCWDLEAAERQVDAFQLRLQEVEVEAHNLRDKVATFEAQAQAQAVPTVEVGHGVLDTTALAHVPRSEHPGHNRSRRSSGTLFHSRSNSRTPSRTASPIRSHSPMRECCNEALEEGNALNTAYSQAAPVTAYGGLYEPGTMWFNVTHNTSKGVASMRHSGASGSHGGGGSQRTTPRPIEPSPMYAGPVAIAPATQTPPVAAGGASSSSSAPSAGTSVVRTGPHSHTAIARRPVRASPVTAQTAVRPTLRRGAGTAERVPPFSQVQHPQPKAPAFSRSAERFTPSTYYSSIVFHERLTHAANRMASSSK